METARQLRAHLADPDFIFGLPAKPAGTLFQRRVWQQIAAIPRGETRSYGEVARALNNAPRAVGQAWCEPAAADRPVPLGDCRRRRSRRFFPARRRLPGRGQALAPRARTTMTSEPETACCSRRPTPATSTRSGDTVWLEDGWPKRRLDSYRGDLSRFALLAKQDRNAIRAATEADLAAYLAELSLALRAASQARYLSSLRRYYRWLWSKGVSRKIHATPRQPAAPGAPAETDDERKPGRALLAAPKTDTPLASATGPCWKPFMRPGFAFRTGRVEASRTQPRHGTGARIRQGRQGAPGPLGEEVARTGSAAISPKDGRHFWNGRQTDALFVTRAPRQ